jgi:hypothetical protein
MTKRTIRRTVELFNHSNPAVADELIALTFIKQLFTVELAPLHLLGTASFQG